MKSQQKNRAILVLASVAVVLASTTVRTDQAGWIELSAGRDFAAWVGPADEWIVAASVALDPKNPRQLAAEPGEGILVNGVKGRARNLITKQKFTDVEAHVEFMVPKGSNSGVKFDGVYEIQILDSADVKSPKGSDCGGIYPRAEEKPKYHHIDDGVPPRVNAAKPAGEWQTLDVIFHAPRFDADGKKITNARFVKATLNGQVIHENVEVKNPTGAAWKNKETPNGSLLLQADHGPVAFRNVRVRPLK